MSCYICETCGTQYAESALPPASCPVCEDERQYVGWQGQRWTTHAELAERYRLRIGEDAGLLALAVDGEFAIPQRALLLPTDAGNILWECLSLVSEEALAALAARGGVDRIVISHPHFYTSMVEWSAALGGVPVLLHAADRAWVHRPSPCLEFWEGDDLQLSSSVSLIRCGGHFPGSTALHWRDGPRPGGALFPGDALQVAQDRRHVSFMYSYPNYLPMRSSEVRAMRERLAGQAFEDVYGYSWGRNILGGGRAAVDASFDRHLAMVAA
ncbi:MAG: MBL fold metallo-hydrolase [Gammaproteobacteria bacterium]|nr:MBL fold metallo-hydrolase [Gammaproteobacteria bacterium]